MSEPDLALQKFKYKWVFHAHNAMAQILVYLKYSNYVRIDDERNEKMYDECVKYSCEFATMWNEFETLREQAQKSSKPNKKKKA